LIRGGMIWYLYEHKSVIFGRLFGKFGMLAAVVLVMNKIAKHS